MSDAAGDRAAMHGAARSGGTPYGGSARRTAPAGLHAALVAAAAVAAFLPALWNGYAYDDVPAILGDARVVADAPAVQVLTRPYWTGAGEALGLWRPLTTASYALDWAVAGGDAWWFHLVNLLLHAAACVLVLLLLRRLFSPDTALLGATLFAVHPVHAEAVANIVGRGDVLAALVGLAALLA